MFYRKRVHIINQSNTSENSSEKVQSIETKGKEGEDAFNSWLNNNGLSFLYVDQSVDTFSTLFKNNVKRPDFLLMLESIGMLAVDVKNYTQSQGTYTLNMEQEFLRSLSFERLFRIPLWYAYKSEKNGETIWLWISALKAIEVGSISINNRSGEKFLRIDVKHFEEIKTNQDIGKLYTHRLPSLNNLSI